MILSQTIEYGFRAVTSFAISGTDGPLSATALASRTGIPVGYLSKVMRRLVVAELVRSQRGHGGGFTLARAPETIQFIDVLDALDFSVEQKRCAFGFGQCDASDPCPLHDSWASLRSSFLEWACSHTLADFAGADCSGPRSIRMS